MFAFLTPLDIATLVVLGAGAVLGFMRGFVSETLSLAGWAVAIFAVKFGFTPLSTRLGPILDNDALAVVIAFGLLFGIGFFGTRMLASTLGRHSRNSILGPFDRMLGCGFGALKGLVALALAFLLFSMVFDIVHGGAAPRPKWMTDARSYPLLRASGDAIIRLYHERERT